jgi:uncharacterized protein with HEPN domain
MSGSPERGLEQWLHDIVSWEERIAHYLRGLDEQGFLTDQRTQDAVIRCLECIGEASRQILALDRKDLPSGIEFLQAYWTRNRLAHGYFDINLQRVWMTATQSAPALAADVRKLLLELE